MFFNGCIWILIIINLCNWFWNIGYGQLWEQCRPFHLRDSSGFLISWRRTSGTELQSDYLLGDPDRDQEESKLWTELSSERGLIAVEASLAALQSSNPTSAEHAHKKYWARYWADCPAGLVLAPALDLSGLRFRLQPRYTISPYQFEVI